jgi:transposase
MDLITYEAIIRSEEAARDYILSFCWDEAGRFCPRCQCQKVYALAEGRLRCGSCRYTFHDLSRRWINFGGLSCQEWLRLVKLFELELTIRRMSPQLKLAYNTVYKAVTALRFSILSKALDARMLLSGAFGLDLGFKNGKIAMDKPGERMGAFPVFGLMHKEGLVFVDLLPHIQADTVFHFHLNFQLKLVRMGNIFYTDRYRQYEALIFCGDETLPVHRLGLKDKSATIDGVRGGFWPFAKGRLKRYNGITPRRFPLYLKELEFRFNQRGEDLFPLLVSGLCGHVPEST